MNDFSGIREILDNNGIQYQEFPNYLKCVAGWRNGDSLGSVTIYPEGVVIDHVLGEKFGFDKLVGKILGIDDEEKIQEYLSNSNYISPQNQNIDEPLIKNENKIFSPQSIQDFGIVPNYDYWINRGISKETAQLFHGGLAYKSKMKNRQVLTIYNSKNKIVGFTGRSVLKDYKIKWKRLGIKKNWIFPVYLNSKIIQEQKEVILVESPACVLKLWDCGIRNIICLFGLEISFPIINFLLRLNDVNIIISTNNEESNRGNDAALKIQKKLKKYFDNKNIFIKLPPDKDFACIEDKSKILEWYGI